MNEASDWEKGTGDWQVAVRKVTSGMLTCDMTPTVGGAERPFVLQHDRDTRTFRVTFPRQHWSKNGAWTWLCRNPPQALVEYKAKIADLFEEPREVMQVLNPWRKLHSEDAHVWECTLMSDEDLRGFAKQVEGQEIREFDPAIWSSVSRRYRNVVRVPPGMTALEALQEFAPEEYKRVMEQHERNAELSWLRGPASRHEGCHETLTEAEWIRFRKAGGESA